jgi:hypothetical protein
MIEHGCSREFEVESLAIKPRRIGCFSREFISE